MTDLPPGFEKRRFVRLPCAFDPRYKEQAPPITVRVAERTSTGTLTDVSVGGVGFVLPVKLEKNSEAEVVFRLQIKDADPFEVAARGIVRHCVPSGGAGAYRTGLEFTSIDKGEQEKLAVYVESIL